MVIWRLDERVRIILAVGLIVLIVSLSGVRQLWKDWKAFDPRQLGSDGITLYERRFDRLKRLLPPHAVVGYVSDAEPYNIEFYLAQYSLSPVIVDPKQPHDVVIGNFANRAAHPATWQGRSLIIRADLANGLKLFGLAAK
jgi:hypothetical protein